MFNPPTPSDLDNPYVGEDGQNNLMSPEIVGPPQYGSPHAATAQGRLTSLKEHPLRAEALPDGHPAAIGSDYGQDAHGLEIHARETTHHGVPTGNSGDDDLDDTEATPLASDTDDDDETNATASAVELAKENNVDLDDVEGTGADGRITKPDVQNYIDEREDDDDDDDDDSN